MGKDKFWHIDGDIYEGQIDDKAIAEYTNFEEWAKLRGTE